MRLIDADAFKEYIDKYMSVFSRYDLRDIKMFINEQPTIEAEPVRHGYWDDQRVAFFRKCSECGATVKNNLSDVFLDCDIRDLRYCPNCGAKMDKEEDDG